MFGLWFQSLFIGITMWALYICIFIVIYGRMIEIYLVTSVAPIPMATMMGKEWGGMGQNYLRSLLALGFQAFLIIVCVAIYAVLVHEHRHRGGHHHGDLELCGLYRAAVFYAVQDRQPVQSRIQRTLTRKEGIYQWLYVPVPKDLTKVKTKVAFNLTKRQLVCFGCGALIGGAAFLFAPGSCWQQRGGHVHDARHAALLHAGDV